jgi:XRE family transcriptional regulator, fatty acid utilization regulator
MTVDQSTGNRIRDRRLDRGLRQTDLAAAVGISPSYLNLIEHNSRRIGGKLLLDIARVLAVEPGHLIEGAEYGVIDGLRAAAARDIEQPVELSRAEDFLGRFPGWAALIIAQARRIDRLEAQVGELSDRLTHDPELATSLHQVITAVTSIRSTASILAGDDTIDKDWQRRFHRNLHDDSVKLAESSRMLVRYLEETGEAQTIRQTPQDEVGRYLDAIDYHVAALERDDGTSDLDAVIEDATARVPGIAIPAAAWLLHDWLERYRADARAMPLGPFAQAARDAKHEPGPLAHQFGVGLCAVMRRLATLPRGQGHPALGLAICDGAGAVLLLKRIPGFSMPRLGAGCPLWPLYQALSQPGRGIRTKVVMPGERALGFLCHALAEPKTVTKFDEVPVLTSMMLVRPVDDETTTPLLPVGPACHICPRAACTARREPSILASY